MSEAELVGFSGRTPVEEEVALLGVVAFVVGTLPEEVRRPSDTTGGSRTRSPGFTSFGRPLVVVTTRL